MTSKECVDFTAQFLQMPKGLVKRSKPRAASAHMHISSHEPLY